MSPSLKHLHDALLILDRTERDLQATIQLSSTDIQDSDSNFERRLNNIVEHQAQLQTQVETLLATFDRLEAERVAMINRRQNGTAGLDEARRRLKQLSLQRKTVQLAILQLELNAL